MTTMTAHEAAVHFEEVLDQVENGETVAITRDARTVATLSATPKRESEFDPDDAMRAAEEWLAYRKEHNITLGGLSIRELIDEGRKY